MAPLRKKNAFNKKENPTLLLATKNEGSGNAYYSYRAPVFTPYRHRLSTVDQRRKSALDITSARISSN